VTTILVATSFLGGILVTHFISHLVPPPFVQALQEVVKILREEERRALREERVNNQQRRPNTITQRLCENIVETVVEKIVDRTIEKVEEKIKELLKQPSIQCEPVVSCDEPAIALSPATPYEVARRR
jgi:hypothetical protein